MENRLKEFERKNNKMSFIMTGLQLNIQKCLENNWLLKNVLPKYAIN